MRMNYASQQLSVWGFFRFIYRSAFVDSSVGCRQNSYMQVWQIRAVNVWTVWKCVYAACVYLIVCFNGGRLQPCGGDLHTICPGNEAGRERENIVHPQMARMMRAGPCPDREREQYSCFCACDAAIVSLLVLCSIYNSGDHFLQMMRPWSPTIDTVDLFSCCLLFWVFSPSFYPCLSLHGSYSTFIKIVETMDTICTVEQLNRFIFSKFLKSDLQNIKNFKVLAL